MQLESETPYIAYIRAAFFCELFDLFVLFITTRVARMYSLSLVCVGVSVRVPKTDNFITTSHFAFTWGVLTHSGLSVRARVSVQGFLPI